MSDGGFRLMVRNEKYFQKRGGWVSFFRMKRIMKGLDILGHKDYCHNISQTKNQKSMPSCFSHSFELRAFRIVRTDGFIKYKKNPTAHLCVVQAEYTVNVIKSSAPAA